MICNECETVAHCTKHGCVPMQPAPVKPVAIPEYIRDAAKHLHENRFEPSFMVRAIVGWINGSPPAAQPAPVPLTDEQIESLLPDDDTPMSLGEAFVKFARLVEAAHGITEKGQP
jgi:hypothetical protein